MAKIKRSYGIICCRKVPNKGLQIVLIKKPNTYHFNEFICGHYRKSDISHLKKLFNNMTYHEKIDILSMKFQLMWYRIYKTTPDQMYNNQYQTKNYLKKKSKFETSFLQDGGVRLKKIIADTTNAETVWEIPKGRKQTFDEKDLNTAIREFGEETKIDEKKYKILFHIKPYIETYSDFGTTYQNIYYYADAVGEWEPSIKFSDGVQISETSAISWCTLSDIKNLKLDKSTHTRLTNMFVKISKKYKNNLLNKKKRY